MKKNRKEAILLCFLFLAGLGVETLWAQSVKGLVKDQQTQEALLFANVVLVKASDSSQVTGTSSNAEGKFVFNKISKGRYFVQVSTLGYHLGNSPVFNLTGEGKEIDLGEILLHPTSLQLQEVEVRAKRPLIEMSPGKIVMNVAEHLASQMAENAFEMLKKFPGVAIDQNDNISLNGKTGVMVMVDSRNTYLGGSDLANYLKAIPATSVSSIEAIANPSSKYDAEGVSGIIDIKTSKLREKGFNGSVSAGLGGWRGLKTNESLDLNYRSNKVSIYGNMSYFYGKGYNDNKMGTTYVDGSQISYNQGEGEDWTGKNIWQGMWARGGADFYPTNKDVVGISYKGSGHWGQSDGEYYTRWLSPQEVITKAMLQSANSKYTRQNHNISANYEHTFDSVYQRKLFADFTWMHNISGGGGSNQMKYYKGNFEKLLSEEGYFLNQPLVSDVYALKLDYEHPFNSQTKLEAGIKGSFVNNNNQMEYIVNGIRDTTRSNTYMYNEWIGAAYIMVNHSFASKTTLQVGLRAELTALEGRNIELDTTHTNFYARPFPNVNISQQIGNDHKLNLAYRYRLSRPHYTDLNPFLLRQDVNSWRSGNPYLAPEYSHNLDLTYSYKYNVFVTMGYSRTDGGIKNLSYYNKVGGSYISTSTPQNLGNSDYLNLSLNGQFTFYERWRLRFYLEGSYGREQFEYGMPNGQKTKQIVHTFSSSAWFSTDVDIIPTLTAELSGWAQFPSRQLFESSKGYFSLNVSIKKTFLDNKLTLTLSGNDLIGMRWEDKSVFPDGTTSTGSYRWDGRQVWLSVSYRFGNNKMMNRAPRQGRGEAEESSRMGSGGTGQGKGGS